jgi:hypothetical protein
MARSAADTIIDVHRPTSFVKMDPASRGASSSGGTAATHITKFNEPTRSAMNGHVMSGNAGSD